MPVSAENEGQELRTRTAQAHTLDVDALDRFHRELLERALAKLNRVLARSPNRELREGIELLQTLRGA